MKRFNKFFGIGLSFAAVAGLASCSNEVNNEPTVVPEEEEALPTVVLPQSPDLVISSNGVALTGTKALVGETREGTLKYENDEVEINLALQDVHMLPNGEQKYDVRDLVSHLSIHVRSNTDVNVTLPVPAVMYCDQDDLYIYNERNEGFKFDGSLNKATYKVENGAYKTIDFNETTGLNEESAEKYLTTTVTLNMEFRAAEGNDKGSIRVWTEGVSQELIDYCRWNYGDGINFDAYNYYNRANQYTTGSYQEYTVQKILEKLNVSKVTFEDKNPDYYINAFTGDPIYDSFWEKDLDRDCWVEPTNVAAFWAPTLGDHNLNHVYLNKTTFPNAQDGDVEENPWAVNAE